MLKPKNVLLLALLCLLLLCFPLGAPAQRAGPVASDVDVKVLTLFQLKQALNLVLAEMQLLKRRLVTQAPLGDRYRVLANRPYTYCPNHRSYEECTHDALKAKYDREKGVYLKSAVSADAGASELRTKYQALEGRLQALEAQIASLVAELSGTRAGPSTPRRR